MTRHPSTEGNELEPHSVTVEDRSQGNVLTDEDRTEIESQIGDQINVYKTSVEFSNVPNSTSLSFPQPEFLNVEVLPDTGSTHGVARITSNTTFGNTGETIEYRITNDGTDTSVEIWSNDTYPIDVRLLLDNV